ncbi:PRC-barrel domain containing protein [Streptomyces sp. NPDC017936]|uniref:PRC-barrel domain containing protein n=1 Tax=Streptomyces sp. NPDC017936 TaxID=3365016 RepID=UPI00379EA52D
MTIDGIWSYAPGSGHAEGQDLTGYGVVAADGTIGHVEREDGHHGMWHLVVDTGVWLFGRSVVVPVGAVAAVDPDHRTVTLACTGDEVKQAPRFRTDSETMDPAYLTAVADYYLGLARRGSASA